MKQIFLFSAIVLFFFTQCNGQKLDEQVYKYYDEFKENSLQHRRFKHKDIVPLIKRLSAPFEVSTAGKSIEGRDIYLVKIGTGETKVLLWSQMHGDESTATMALMDIFNFFSAQDGFDAFRKKLLSNCTFYFIPMLNPDGADKFQRRNALGVDLNREALRLQSPEARILKNIRDETHADWGFNLHDQNRYYAAGNHPKTATISFLAPAFNEEKEISFDRADAMKLIAVMNESLQRYIPGQVAKYDDSFEVRAFGDNIQKWGTKTILIESGALKGDREKQEIRKLNFTILLTAFNAISSKKYEKRGVDEYESIPFNNSNAFHDLVLREVEIKKENNWYKVDIAFRSTEVGNKKSENGFYLKSKISDIGDLSTSYAYHEFKEEGYATIIGKTYPKIITSINMLRALDVARLWAQGYTSVRLSSYLPAHIRYGNLPIQVLLENKKITKDIKRGKNPSLLIQKNGQTRFVVVNGQLFDTKEDSGQLGDWME